MTSNRQHSRSSSPPSNLRSFEAWRLVGAACRDVAAAPTRVATVEGILERALEATGFERAFVVGSLDGRASASPRVHVSVCRRRDGDRTPSETVLRRSLAGRRVLVCDDAASDPRLSSGASVRSLRLRFVISAPIAFAEGRAALVLDSGPEAASRPSEVRELLQAFAGLVGLAIEDRSVGSSGSGAAASPVAEMVGESPAFRDLVARASEAARWPLPVLVTGESGTGKEGIARLLHSASPRRDQPFVAINCGAIAETLLEAELFGAVRGAYTGLQRDRSGLFRIAHRGTLLLDEVGDMSPGMQVKLLRILQDGRLRPVGSETEEAVDVRVVAATHRDLVREIERGRFRQDLYYRLAVLELHTPPLRDRRLDIPLLARHLGARISKAAGREEAVWTEAALEHLRSYDWPGNIRQLESIVARALLRSRGDPIQPRHLELPRGATTPPVMAADGLEARMIESALRQSGGVLARAAAEIGWSRQKLKRRMNALGIERRT